MQVEISFGTWLRKQRRALDLSQLAFAQQIGCAEVTLRRIEGGTLKPSKELAVLILEKLGIVENEWPQWISFARGLSGFPSQSIPASNKPTTNLPASLTTFIGREKEQSEVIGLITKHRLVTLTGAGGVGKTRLSLKIGEQVLGNYADGVWLVELAPILDSMLVPRTTAIAIGLRDEPQRPVIDMLCDYMRKKELLLILDNCEHLLEACAKLADTLLKNCPSLRILATTRETLGILGEAAYRVPSLQLPDFQQLLENFRRYESVHLFEERAQLAQMNFSLTMENASAVANICTHLDGIPLAIELAAARVGSFSTEQIEARLHERFSLLTTGNRSALPRHQTLKSAIDWSYDLLSPAERSVFQRLSVFVNGWTLEAAEAICSDANITPEDILDVLIQLTNKSLVVRYETQVGTRYRMLETIRQYTNEKLVESGEGDALCDRHLNYFLNMAQTAEPYLIRPKQIVWVPLLDADYENLRLAIEWALSKESAETSLNLCKALFWFWVIRGYWLEGLNWLKRALAKPHQNESVSEKISRVRALYSQAGLESRLGNLEQLLSPAQASLALALQVSDQRDIAIARFFVGNALEDNDHAQFLLEQSLADFQKLDEPFWEAQCYSDLGLLLAKEAKLKFSDMYLRWLELARKAGERIILAYALWAYAEWLIRMGRAQDANEYIEESDKLLKQIGSENTSISSLLFAEIALDSGHTQKARALFMQLYERFSLLGEKVGPMIVMSKLGILAIEDGNLDRAQIDLEQALIISRKLEHKPYIANRLIDLSTVFYLQGNLEAFKQCVRETFALKNHFVKFQETYILMTVLSSVYELNAESTARLLGVYDRYEREYDFPPSTTHGKLYDRAKAHARKNLGDAGFESAFAEGQKLSLDEALDLALKTVEEM